MRSQLSSRCLVWTACLTVVGASRAANKPKGSVTPMKVDVEVTITMKQPPQMPAAKGKAGGAPPPPMMMTGTTWIKSKDKMRSEMNVPQMGGGKQVTILSGENIYVVDDARKTIQKSPWSAIRQIMSFIGMGGLGGGMPDPKDLENLGLKKSGTEAVGKDSCYVYKGKVGTMDMTVWLREGDHLAIKSTGSNAMMDVNSVVKKVEMNPSMPDSLFAVPNYPVTDLGQVFGKAKANAQSSACMSNMKQLAIATLMYAQDHKGNLPDSKKVKQEVKPYVKNDKLWTGCNAVSGAGSHYAMNSKCPGNYSAIAKAANTIMFFECDAKGRPANRHDGGMNVAFADGHVKWMAKGTIKPGMWKPQAGD